MFKYDFADTGRDRFCLYQWGDGQLARTPIRASGNLITRNATLTADYITQIVTAQLNLNSSSD
jgi:hypothetical protein